MTDIPKSTRPLDRDQIAVYQRDGVLRVPNLFDAEELEPLRQALRKDPTVNGQLYGMVDREGGAQPICAWTELCDDIIGMIPRMARMVDATELLLGEACYHWHSKITIKPPQCTALVDWHQDFYSWYDDGVLFPRLITAGIAIEPSTLENGCMQVVPGSHRMGRIGHGGYDPVRFELAKEKLGVIHCELEVGDAVFFDCNTLHGSDANPTDQARVLLLSSYNAVSNEPFEKARGPNIDGAFMNITSQERVFRPLEKLPDDVLAKHRYKSAFHHTRFKGPRTETGEGYSEAVLIK